MENKKCTCQDLEYGEKSENLGKWETHTVGSEIFKETLKKVKNENSKLEEQEYGKKTETVENETQTLYDLEYGEKH